MRKSRFTDAQIIGMIKEQEAGGPVTVLFRSGSHVKRPFVQKPRGFSSLNLNVCGGGYRSR